MWKDLTSLTRSEQKGIIVLMAIVILLTGLLFVPKRLGGTSEFMPFFADSIASFGEGIPMATHDEHLFAFNPNEVTIKELEQLKLNSKAIINWKKFQEAGGTFRTPEDIRKIYGVDSAFFNKVKSWVVFNSSESDNKYEKRERQKPSGYKHQKLVDLNLMSRNQLIAYNLSAELLDSLMHLKELYWFRSRIDSVTLQEMTLAGLSDLIRSSGTLKNKKVNEAILNIELNSADTTELVLLKGIGPVLARRIVQYRQKIGGFYKPEQLLEVYGFSPIVLNEIRPFLSIDKSLIVPINLNAASLKSLKEHPFIGFYKAKDIVEYRKSKGKIDSLKEVYRLSSFSDADTLVLNCYMSIR
jgi:DNA uptake protein ComE-like DNA-binding protein